MYILVNESYESDSVRTIALSEGYNFGYGVFETIRVENCELVFFSEHMDRLRRGLEKIGLDSGLDYEDILLKARELIRLNRLKNGALKIILSKNKENRDMVLSTREVDYPEKIYKRGFKLNLSESMRNAHSLMPYLKSLNYMENIIERKKSTVSGFDDCLFLNTEGFIAETSISNLFFIKKGMVFTPSIDSGILDGIIRAKVIKIADELGYRVYQGKYRLDDILNAEEVFLTNSLMGIMPVGELQCKRFDVSEGKMTRDIQRRYGEIVDAETGA